MVTGRQSQTCSQYPQLSEYISSVWCFLSMPLLVLMCLILICWNLAIEHTLGIRYVYSIALPYIWRSILNRLGEDYPRWKGSKGHLFSVCSTFHRITALRCGVGLWGRCGNARGDRQTVSLGILNRGRVKAHWPGVVHGDILLFWILIPRHWQQNCNPPHFKGNRCMARLILRRWHCCWRENLSA